MSDPLKPLFFIVRDNGIITPLIATDELPHHIRLEGIPRNLSVEETEGMTNIGKFPARHQCYKVININDKTKTTPSSLSLSSDDNHDNCNDNGMPLASPSSGHALSNIAATNSATSQTEYSPPTPLGTDKACRISHKTCGVREQRPAIYEPAKIAIANPDADLIMIRRTSTPSASIDDTEVFRKPGPLPSWKDKTVLGSRLPPPGKKVYCSHWMSTGECDFAQQGCMFKHEMPLDLELLNFLGYQDIPKWYRERHGIGRLTAVPGSGAHLVGTAGAHTHQSEPVLSPSWSPAARKNSKQSSNRKPSKGRFGQLPKSPFSNSSSQTSTKINGGVGSRQNIKRQELNGSDGPKPQGRIADSAERKPTSSLLDSRYAPMRPSNNTTSGPKVCGQNECSNSSSYYPSNGSSTTAIDSPRTTIIAQAYPTPSNPPHLRRESTISHVSAFSDVETDVVTTNVTRRTSEEERYAKMCVQAKRG